MNQTVSGNIDIEQTATTPHNVQLRGAGLGDKLMGPSRLSVGETYDVVIGESFPVGVYNY